MRITAYADPATGQINAMYVNCDTGNPESWTNAGNIRVEIPDEHAQDVRTHGRNGKLALDNDGKVTGVSASTNPVQPVKPEKTAAVQAMSKADPSMDDLIAYIKERDGLS